MAVKYYAYFLDKNKNGIVEDWDSCKKIITGTRARYKSFKNIEEAQRWLCDGANYDYGKKIEKIKNFKLEDGVYFDAGTGRGFGVEVRVTNKNKEGLIDYLLDEKVMNFLDKNSWKINEFGNILLDKGKTNNYGELLGLYFALEYARRNLESKIFGDSKLVIDYWSLGYYKKENIKKETTLLIEKVTHKRKEFEKVGGQVIYISGDLNPADLGFHK